MYTIENVPADEIAANARGKWAGLHDALMTAHEAGTGVFVHPFAKTDAQNLAQSIRKGLGERGLRLRWKVSTRAGNEGMYLWVERA